MQTVKNFSIQLIPTTPLDGLWTLCLNLYMNSFPEDERREVNELNMMPNEPFYNLYSIVKNNVFTGFVEIWEFPGFTFIEHLAVTLENRGMGIGKHILGLIKEGFLNPVILEAEPPINELSRRRIEFYTRSGFMPANINYGQPPYYPGKIQVPMLLLSNVTVPVDRLEAFVVQIRKLVYFTH